MIILISLALQLAAAYCALRLIPRTGRKLAWILLASALVLMAARRAVTIYQLYARGEPLNLTTETIALLISILTLSGVVLIGAIFDQMQTAARSLAQNQADLERASRLFEQVQAAARIGGWELDFATDRVYWTSETYRIHETTPQEYSPTLDTALRFYTPESLPIVRSAVEQGRTRGDPWDLELGFITAKGRRIWVRALGKIEMEDGRPVRAYGAFQDITEHKKAQDAIAHERAVLRTLIDNLPDHVYMKDAAGRYTASNVASLKLLHVRSEKDLLGKTVFDFFPREVAERYAADDQAVFGSGLPVIDREEPYIDPDGKPGWYWTTKLPLRDADGRITGLVGISRDVTERKRTEEAFRSVVEATESATGEEYLRRMIAQLASVMTAQFALVGELQPGPPPRMRFLAAWGDGVALPAFEQELPGSACEQVLQRGTYHEPQGVCGACPDDSTLQELRIDGFLGIALRDSHGANLGVLLVMDRRPIAATGQTQDLLRVFAVRAAGELERRRSEAERQRLESKVQHAQKLESLGVLAGGIAHDFSNLLTGILGNASLALMSLPPESPARASLEQIELASTRAAELCRQMLAYSGRGKFVVTALDLSSLVQEMAYMLQVSISKKAVLRLELAKDLPAIDADATQLRQVVMNLITNASDAIGDRSGVISIRTGAMHCDHAYLTELMHAPALAEGAYVFLEVCDTGAGMDAETRARIFDPFFTTKFTGRGLGLAAVLGIVRGHRGAIRVYSEVGRGSSFKVLLPMGAGAAGVSEAAPAGAERWRGSGAILVADDEELIRRLATMVLKEAGFDVLTADNGQRAIDLYKEHRERIVAVVLDMTMPVLNGEETYRELRRIKPDVRVILSSGYSESEALQRFQGRGLAGFVQKPYRPKELLDQVRAALEQAPARC